MSGEIPRQENLEADNGGFNLNAERVEAVDKKMKDLERRFRERMKEIEEVSLKITAHAYGHDEDITSKGSKDAMQEAVALFAKLEKKKFEVEEQFRISKHVLFNGSAESLEDEIEAI